MGESTPTERALRILALLQRGRVASAGELATRLGVDARTVRRDITRLRALGYRIDADAGPGGGYQLAAAETLPPLQLDPEQAEAVAVGLHLVATSDFEGLADEALTATHALLRLLPPEGAARVARIAAALSVVPSEAPGVSAELRSDVTDAIAARVRIRFAYRARSGVDSERNVEPYRAVRFANRWYLVAFDLVRDDWRTFRLDRMREVHRTTFTFRPRAAPDAVEHVRASVLRGGYGTVARVRLRAPIEWLRDRVPATAGELVAVDADETDFVTGADSAAEGAPYLAALGCEIVSASPPQLAAALRELGRRLVGVTDG